MLAYWIDRKTGQEATYVIDVTPARKGQADYFAYQASLVTVNQINQTLHSTHDLRYRIS